MTVDPELRPLSARSVVLSLLLGAHPPQLAARDLVRVGEEFGIAEQTLRVALTRLVGSGDLVRTDATYRLSDRLLERQRRQDDAITPATRAWRGGWEFAVVTGVGRAAGERADLRAVLGGLRLAEVREGVWLRPANLRRPWPADLDPAVRRFTARPDDDPVELAASLWDLDAWAAGSRALLIHLDAAAGPAERIAVAAALVRHLVTDPVLPAPVLPRGWPAADLRAAYRAYQAELTHTVAAHRLAG